MDPTAIGGLVLAALGVLAAFGAWLRPRAPKEPPVPAVAASHSSGPDSLKVRASFGFLTYHQPPWLSDEQMLLINVANPTPRPSRIVAVGLAFEGDGKTMPWIHPDSLRPLPFVLSETEDNQFWVPLREVGKTMLANQLSKVRRVRGFVRDSYDNTYYSDWFDANPDEWAADS